MFLGFKDVFWNVRKFLRIQEVCLKNIWKNREIPRDPIRIHRILGENFRKILKTLCLRKIKQAIWRFFRDDKSLWCTFPNQLHWLLECFCKRPTPPFLVNFCPLKAVWQSLCTGVAWRAGLLPPSNSIQSGVDPPSIHSLVRLRGEAPEPWLAISFWLGTLSGAASSPDGQGLSEHHCGSA